MNSFLLIILTASSLQSYAVLLGGDRVEDSDVFERWNETTTQCDDLHIMCPRTGDVVMRRSSTKNAFHKWMTEHFAGYSKISKERAAISSLYGIYKLAGGATSSAVDVGVVPIPGIGLATRGMVWLATWIYDKVVGCGSVSFEFCGPHKSRSPNNVWSQAMGSDNMPKHKHAGEGLPAMSFDFAAYAYLQAALGKLKFPDDGIAEPVITEEDNDETIATKTKGIVDLIEASKPKIEASKTDTTWAKRRELVRKGHLSLQAYGLTACASIPDLGGWFWYSRGLTVSYNAPDGNKVTTQIPKMSEFDDEQDFTNPESPWAMYMNCFAMLCGELTEAFVANPHRLDFVRGVDANSCDRQDSLMVLYDSF